MADRVAVSRETSVEECPADDDGSTNATVATLRQELEFETLLAKLSTNFIRLSSEEIDEGIREAIEAVAEFTGLDAALVALFADERRTSWSVTHEWCSDGLEPLAGRLVNMKGAPFAWSYQAFLRGEAILLTDLDSLPHNAAAERALYEELQQPWALLLPVTVQDDLVGFACFASSRRGQQWSEDFAALTRLVTEMVVSALERKRNEEELRYRNEFDRLVATLSMRLINLPASEIDGAIDGAVQEIAEFTGVDRCGVYLLEDSAEKAKLAHGCRIGDASGNLELLVEVPLADLPQWHERLSTSEVVHVPDSDRPNGAGPAEAALLSRRGIKTLVTAPMSLGGSPAGFITFASIRRKKKWTEESIALLRVFAGIIANALARKRAEEERHEFTGKLERRVRQRTAQLEAANKELEAFSYSVSHDLRTPLRGIEGFGKILLDEHGDTLNDDGKDLVERMRRASRRLDELIGALLALSRITRTEIRWENVNLSEIAREVAASLQCSEPERKVTFDIAPDLIVRGTPVLLQVLVENLIGNAWKFTSKHETARVEVGKTRIEDEDVLFIRDDGVGFEPDCASQLFRAFRRLHRADEFDGHGIGLATVKRIADLHRGKVWAESKVKEGATVYFTLGSGS